MGSTCCGCHVAPVRGQPGVPQGTSRRHCGPSICQNVLLLWKELRCRSWLGQDGPRGTVLSERKQTRRLCPVLSRGMSRSGSSTEAEHRGAAARGWGMGSVCWLGVVRMFWNYVAVMVIQLREYTKAH